MILILLDFVYWVMLFLVLLTSLSLRKSCLDYCRSMRATSLEVLAWAVIAAEA